MSARRSTDNDVPEPKTRTRSKTLTARLSYTKSTTHTHRFDSPDHDSAVHALYVEKTALGEAPPSWITLKIEVSDTFSAPRLPVE